MNPAFLKYYNEELYYLRELGGEFAARHPKVAGRLGLEKFECADPYAERLLEGFSFLTARIRMKMDAAFPRFTQHLAEIVYPQYLAPVPSMAVVEFHPDWAHPSLKNGQVVPRDTPLRSNLDRHSTTRCEYRTAHDLTLWPLELTQASYTPCAGAIDGVAIQRYGNSKAVLKLRFAVHGGMRVCQLALDRLPIFLRGADALPARLYELLLGRLTGVLVSWKAEAAERHVALPVGDVLPLGFSDDEALLPLSPTAFRGYRYLQEYFAFPQRCSFVEVQGMSEALRRCEGAGFDMVVLLDRYEPDLERLIDASNFGLYCTPAINLFPRRADRIAVDTGKFEYHLVPDRTRPIDYEIYAVKEVRGYRNSDKEPRCFQPFFQAADPASIQHGEGAYFQLRREPRRLAEREVRYGARSRYVGSDVFLSLLDMQETSYNVDVHQLGVDTLCTNRDLPLSMSVGVGTTDFFPDAGFPVTAVRCIAGPSEPRPALADSVSVWRLLNLLSLNYLSLTDDPANDAGALRRLLQIHCPPSDEAGFRQIIGLSRLASRPITRRLSLPGPVCFGRGLEVALTFDDEAFQPGEAFLLGSVLQAFFGTYVSINQFTETVVRTSRRGEIMRWPVRMGLCHFL